MSEFLVICIYAQDQYYFFLQIRRRRLARLAAVTTTRVPTPTPTVSDVIPQQISQCNKNYLNL